MVEKPPYKELENRVRQLKKESAQQKRFQNISTTLFQISKAVNTTNNLDELYESIHRALNSIIDTTNFYISLYDKSKDRITFPYCIDSVDECYPPQIEISKTESLTGKVIQTGQPLLITKDERLKQRAESRKKEPACTPSEVWLGVPLKTQDGIIGAMAVQSYSDQNCYDQTDMEVMLSVADQIAVAIELKRAEDALRKSEKKHRHLFKNAPSGIYEIDFEKVRFLNVNELMCKHSGYSEEEFLSMNPLDLLTEESKKLYIERLGKLSTGEKLSDNIEYNILKKNGQKLSVLLSNDFIYKNGKLTGARVVAHDITELKQAQEEKINAQKIAGEHEKLALVGQVAGKMAHDFNNILSVIMGNSELALFDCKETETRKTLKLIFEQTLRGKNLTKNLITFAMEQEPKQEFLRINEKINFVLNLLEKDLEGIEVIKEDKSDVPDLLADSGMLEHAVLNFLQNSIHATSMNEHPRIIIRTYCLNENICFEIEDNGCGISKEHFEKIYEPSFTLKGSRDVTGSYKPGIRGTGYGLSNIKKYIDQHKGTISIESELGSGTKFTICLPVIKKELTIDEKTQIQKETTHFKKRILLVEDEQALSDILYRILTQEPCSHKVDIAPNGQVAMDLFDRNEYDFVSLDYILPGKINGMDVYNHIREKNKNIPILFVSGNIEFLESIKDLKQNDANIEHLSKPCQNKDYVKSINELLERKIGT
ncbi:ATP-binding protein [Desulfobacula sp.]|uniref:ATP-binding protein n=1 Tax=Desulfobacula sp. TaxID=2593537 RepID=UPI0026109A99|nr:ATP-binding protein [Desulfobacula sp.]